MFNEKITLIVNCPKATYFYEGENAKALIIDILAEMEKNFNYDIYNIMAECYTITLEENCKRNTSIKNFIDYIYFNVLHYGYINITKDITITYYNSQEEENIMEKIALEVNDKNYNNIFEGNSYKEIVTEIVCEIYDVNELMPEYYNGDSEMVSVQNFIDDLVFDLTNEGIAKIATDMTISVA